MSDREFIQAAIELAADRVLFDPSDYAIVLAVEEIVGRPVVDRWAHRIRPAILSAYERTERAMWAVELGEVELDTAGIERSVASTFGL